nr:unnamed protein product [Callosobruchus analis]
MRIFDLFCKFDKQTWSDKNVLFLRYVYATLPQATFYIHHHEARGPLQFIGNWIASSDWFPIEVNVPDIFSHIGSGVGNVAQTVGQVAQNMGSGIMTFTQNVGSGIQSFAQGIGQRVPFIGTIVRPTTTTNYMLVVPSQKYGPDRPLSQMESDILEKFP